MYISLCVYQCLPRNNTPKVDSHDDPILNFHWKLIFQPRTHGVWGWGDLGKVPNRFQGGAQLVGRIPYSHGATPKMDVL